MNMSESANLLPPHFSRKSCFSWLISFLCESFWLGPALVIASLTLAMPAAWATQPVQLEPGVHQLFLDDAMVAERSNVISTMHRARKFAGNPVLMPEPGVETHALLYGTVLYDDESDLFKAWYCAGREGTKMPWCQAYATSTDGIHWEKPDLDVVEGLRSPANVVMTHPVIENYGEPDGIIIDRRDPDPARRYKSVYRYLTPLPAMEALGTTTATSPDGIHWTPYGRAQMPKILDYGHFFYDQLKGKYAVYGRWWGERRKVQLSLSDDFQSWSEPVLVADRNEKDPPGAQVYSMAVHNDGGQYVGLVQLYMRGTTHLLEFELAASRDGLSWTRVHQGERFLPCGGPGEWDRFNNSISCNPVRVGDELWFYYSGRTYRHGGYSGKDWGTETEGSERARVGGRGRVRGQPDTPEFFQGMRGAIGLAKLRLDGYVSLDASYDGGSVTTVPVLPGGDSLHLNAAARWGDIVVEVLGPDGEPVAGGVSEPVSGNDTDLIVRWPDGQPNPLATGDPVQLRFKLRNARLYAYWVR
jgi:hypothetical protein